MGKLPVGFLPSHFSHLQTFKVAMQTLRTSLVASLVLSCAYAAPQPQAMTRWACNDCPYSTDITEGLVEFASNSQATGALKVKYIVGDAESVIGDSLEVKGPISGYATARAQLRFHSGDDCSSEVLYSETCRNCQQYISIKVLKSKKNLTIGGENDVMGKALSIVDSRKGSMLACAKIVPLKTP